MAVNIVITIFIQWGQLDMLWRRLTFLGLFALLVFLPTQTAAAAPLPNVSLDAPATIFIGETLQFSVTFSNNAASDIGYGPFIDLWLPRNGADGAAGTDTPDGITFKSAEYLTTPVTAIIQTFPAGGCVSHPFLRDAQLHAIAVCGTPGDQFVVLELPFGSFTPAQPDVEVEVSAALSDLADLNVALPIRVRGGFRFGADPVDNPCCDFPIVSPEDNASVTPILMTIDKESGVPEGEIPSGANFTNEWTITVDIAGGQTITNLDVTDFLPPQVTFGTVVSAVPALSGPPTFAGGNVIFPIASVTGTTAKDDVQIVFSFTANDILDPNTGVEIEIYNAVQALGDWQPNDARDGGGQDNAFAEGLCTAASCPGGDAPIIMSLAAQKTAQTITTASSGGILEYNVDFQISDYFAFGGVVLTDIISDGQHLDPGFPITLSYTEHGVPQTNPVNAANYDVLEYWTGGNPGIPAVPPATNGDTVLVVRASDQVGDPLLGGCVPPAGTANPDCGVFSAGATTARLTYRTIILDQFVNDFPSGDPSVDQGDVLDNSLIINGQILNPLNFTPGGFSQVTDDTETDIEIERGGLNKSIYAVNGTPCGACTNLEITTGDTITYRIQQTLPSSDFEDLRLVDYLPLPVLNAAEVTNFVYTIDTNIPPAGTAKFYANDTLYNLMQAVRPGSPQYPVIQVDTAANSVTFNYGAEFDDPANNLSQLDILFTVTVSDQPFADGLTLTNVVEAQEASTNAGDSSDEAIVQFDVTSPLLLLKKGVVASSNANGQFNPVTPGPVPFNPPGSATPFNGTISSDGLTGSPINSDITGIQVGDVLTFAIVIENLGSNPTGAFDIEIRDTIANGFAIPSSGLNLNVQLGNGVPVNYLPLGASGTDNDLFDQGIELVDPGANGACGEYAGDTGLNIVIITYDLQIAALTSNVLTNTASLTNYASSEGGADYTGNQDQWDTATAYGEGGGGGTGTGVITKSVDNPFAQPGERVAFTIDVKNTSSLGLTDAMVSDTLPTEFEPISASASRGTVSLIGQTYNFTIGALAPNESVSMTINARIRLSTKAPYNLINTALLLAGGKELGRDDANVLSAKTLAATGESWLTDLRLALMLGGMFAGVTLVAGWFVYRSH